ncbi:class II fructose-bisphosphate aldolase [Streptomyces sp. NPDC004752]
MLSLGRDVLTQTHASGRALGAFSVYNIELAQAVLDAAAARQVPVLLQAGSSSFGYAGEEVLAKVALTLAEQAPGQVGVHLDHCRDLEEIRRCLDRGYTSVMIDGSHLDFAANVELTARAVKLAAPYGAWVEAELGEVAGDEDSSTQAHAAGGTDPEAAGRFVQETGADALAVAIGNVHGMTSRPVTLDLDRLRDIQAHCPVPLVLHGASGIPDDQVAAAIALGVAKVNVNAEVRGAYIRALNTCEITGDGLAAFSRHGITAATAVVDDKLRLFTETAAAYGDPHTPSEGEQT